MSVRGWLPLCLMFLLCGCQSRDRDHLPPLLTGRAILPADTFLGNSTLGTQLDSNVNGREFPLNQVPVQGISSLVDQGDGEFLALQDNGFGTRLNSPDYPLRWYVLRLDLDSNKPHGGPVTLLRAVPLSDPDGHLQQTLSHPDRGRALYGADFDPESMVRLDDGTIWIGEEFGPSLLHFDDQGRLLEAPIPVPVAPALRPFGRGSYFLRSPDHPDLRHKEPLPPGESLASLPRSGGVEGLTRNRKGSLLYLITEKAMRDDPDQQRRSILEFDPRKRKFTSGFWFYQTDYATTYPTSLEWIGGRKFLVLERDDDQGAQARIKRVYRVDLNQAEAHHFLPKELVCDLLKIQDGFGFSAKDPEAFGLGSAFKFPYITPEALLVLDAETILLCNDNNYPFSSGRMPGAPEDSEFIRLKLPAPLSP